MASLKKTIYASFGSIEDPRAANRAHPLETVLFSLVVGVLCGGDGFIQAARLAEAKKKFISKYVPLPNGIPTHDTMARVLSVLDPKHFLQAFVSFVSKITRHEAEDLINIDGKTLRGAVNKRAVEGAAAEDQVHVVSALSSMRRVVLGQLRSGSVANEVKAAQELIQMLDVEGAVVTLDAAHTTRKTVQLVTERGGDIVVSVKTNTQSLFNGMQEAFQKEGLQSHETAEHAHGRVEHRKYDVAPASGKAIEKNYKPLRSFVRVTRQRYHPTGPTSEPRESYYASSIPPEDVEKLAHCIRGRWAIENSLHYVLDVAFREDASRVRIKNAAENLSRIRHIVLSLLKQDKTEKVGVAVRRLVAASDDRYLRNVLCLPRR